MIEEVYFLMEPDDGHYNRQYAEEIINELAERYEVVLMRTHETRDTGFGQEELFLVEGNPGNIDAFVDAVNDALY